MKYVFIPMAGIYIHIPFCKRRCGYCDFFSSTDIGGMEVVMAAIIRELEQRKALLGGEAIRTLYIGGGTPSLCSIGVLGGLIGCVGDNFETSNLTETTVEANPDDLSAEYLDGLLSVGFNRLSIGVQSFDDSDLRLMNRRHNGAAAIGAVRRAQEAGFENISIDLIYGVPGMTHRGWRENIETAIGLGVQHISAYHLGIEPGTRFAELVDRGVISPVKEQQSREQYMLLHEELEAARFDHYEISNFALPGFQSQHNSSYWSGVPYLGVGPSAHSFYGRVREWNPSSIGDYLAGEGRRREELSEVDSYNELVMLSLRTSQGLDPDRVFRAFGSEYGDYFLRAAQIQLTNGMLEIQDGCYRIPACEFLVADSIIGDLFRV